MTAVIEGELTNNILRLVVKAPRLDAPTARALKTECGQLWTDETDAVVIDLEAVEFIDIDGIGALVGVYERLPASKQLRLIRVRPPVQSVVELLRLDQILPMES